MGSTQSNIASTSRANARHNALGSLLGQARMFPDGASTLTSELVAIFDELTDIVFTIKDVAGQYTHVNRTLAHRLGLHHRNDVIGRTPIEVYPTAMGEFFMEQDRRVLSGNAIMNALEPQFFPIRAPGWCLTHKRPLYRDGAIHGLVSFSRDLGHQPSRQRIYTRLRAVVETIQHDHTENLRMQSLADEVGMSLLQLERHFKQVFAVTPQQMLTRLRIEHAKQLLAGDDNLVTISQTCGFSDQSSFSRKFSACVGMTPGNYRSSLHRQHGAKTTAERHH